MLLVEGNTIASKAVKAALLFPDDDLGALTSAAAPWDSRDEVAAESGAVAGSLNTDGQVAHASARALKQQLQTAAKEGLASGLSVADVTANLVGQYGLTRNKVYSVVLQVRKSMDVGTG